MLDRVSGLTLRITAATVITVAILVPTVGYFATQAAATQTMRSLIDRVRPARAQAMLAACEANPSAWTDAVEGRFEVFAYDAETLRSHNPAAPPLDERLKARLLEGEERPSRLMMFGGEWAGALVDQQRARGPCAITQMRWRPNTGGRRNVQRRGALVLLVLLFVGALVTMLLAVRPIVRRLRAVARAAHAVGDADRFVSSDDKTQDAIGALSSAIDDAHWRIVSDRSALKEHLANIAHDIRTPLSSLQLTLEGMSAQIESPEQRARLNSALDELTYIDGLINNLHLASKVERDVGPLDGGHEVDLASTVDFVLARFRVVGRRRGIEVSGSRPDQAVPVRCDPWMMQQVLSNLVDNAVKYGQEGGHVAVVLEADGERFELFVLDDGPGVSAEALDRLTERTFRSTEAIRRDAGGAGLGLAIALKVCELAGFKITLNNADPRGFRVEIEGALTSE